MKALFTIALLALPFAAFPNGYSYCKVVTTSVTMVSGSSDLVNYPLTVILTDADLKTTGNGGLVNNANGYDIGFYPDCAGSGTALKWEMESYSATTGAIVAHVLRPTLSHTTNDTIGMYYGGGFSSFQSTASAVWDANYKGVWHLKEPTGSDISDSTSNGVTGTQHNSPTQTAGKIAGSLRYDGSTQYHSETISSGLSSSLTFSAWAYLTGTSFVSSVMNSNVASYSNYWANLNAYDPGTGRKWFFAMYDGTQNPGASSAANVTLNVWVYLVGVRNTSTKQLYLYRNGILEGTVPDSTTSVPSYSAFNIGAQVSQAGRYFPGTIDEARVSNIARSADWVLTEYRNQSAPGTYISAGARITGGAGSRMRHVVRDGV
jgi:hypothetical protein